MFVFDLFEKKKQDPAAGRFVGGTSQDARVKNALDNAYRAVPAAKSPEEAALGYIDIQNSLNQKQDQVLSQQNKTNQQQTQQINSLVADMRRKEKDFRDLNAQVASMPNVTPQQVAKMAQDIEAAHDTDKDQTVDIPSVIAKQTTAQPAVAPVAAPSPGASISQIANFQQSQDRGATAVAAKPATAPTKSAAGAQAFGAMASQLGGTSGVENLPSQTYAAKATPGDTLKKNAVAQATGTNVPVPTGSADDVNVLDPDVIAAMTKDQEKSAMTEAYREGDPNQGSLNWTALIKAWSARSPSVDWRFGEKKSMRLYQPHMYALLQVIGNLHNAVEQEDIIQNVFSIRQRVDDLLNDTVTKQYMTHYAKWQQEQLEKQQQNQAQQSLLEPTGQPAEKGIEPEPQQGDLFKEDSWHAGNNAWSSEHDQWARESQGMAVTNGDIKKKMSKLEALALAANRAGDDAKCKMYQQKVQSLKQKLSQSMTEELSNSPVAGAITRRILMQRLDLLKQYGPELVGAAVDNVADYVGDVDEIGSSDVSGWVNEVERMLKDNPPEAFREQELDEFNASGYNRYSIYMDDYDLKEKFASIDDAVEAIEEYKRDDPKSQYEDYNVRDLNGKVVWRNDAWRDAQKPGKIQFLPPTTGTSENKDMGEATGDSRFDAMMGRISQDPWTQLNSDPNWQYEIEELVDQHIEPWLLAMEKSGMPITRDNETLNPGWRKRYEQVATQLAQKYLAFKKLNPRDPDLVGKIRYAIDWHTDESKNVHGQLSAYSELPLARHADAFDADGMTANMRDAMVGFIRTDDDDDDEPPTRPMPDNDPRRLDPGNMEEGWSDAVVARRTGQPRTPYSVYIKGRKWKDFNNDDHAQAVADKLRAKFKADGRDPETITIAPTDIPEGVNEGLLYSGDTWEDVLYRINVLNDIFGDQKDLAATFEPASQPEWIPLRDRILRSRTVLDTYAKVKQLANMNVPLTDVEIEMLADVAWDGGGGPVKPAGHWGERDYDWLEDLYAQQFAVVQHLVDQRAQGYGQNKTKSGQTVHEQGVAEAPTDYSKRRARERDVDAGRPVPKQRPSKMTDYQKRRAQDKKDMELGETINYWTRLQQERFLREHKKAFDLIAELEQSIKDIK